MRKSQLGQTGRCPSCRAAVNAAKRASIESAVAPGEPPELLLERIAVAKTMTVEEVEMLADAVKSRKRKHVDPQGENIDWEDQIEAGGGSTVSWKVVGSLLMSALVLGALGVYFLNQATPTAEANTGLSDDDTKALVLLNEIVDAQRRTGKEDESDGVVKAVDDYNKFDIPEAEVAVKSFLNARNVEERKKTIRDLERVGPLLDLYYSKVDYEPEGFESLNKLEVSYRGNFLTTMAQKADFLSSPIVVARVVSEDGETYKIDWESWVGYCDFTPVEMRLKKPAVPFLMRVLIEPANYYNYGFGDDEVWRSYGLELKSSEYSFLGYAKRNSEID
ncbi:MAG: hypothetical protein ACJAVK_003121, partial [Akkermansiaceae bacterium]